MKKDRAKMKRNVFCGVLMVAAVLGAGIAHAETPVTKTPAPAAKSKLNSSEGTKFYNPTPLPKIKFEWPEFKFPKFFEQSGQSETASGGQQLKAAAKPDSAAQGEDELLTHMNQMSGVLEKIKEILRNYAASQEDPDSKKIAQSTKPLAVSEEAVAPAGEGNLQALLGDLMAAQKDAPKIDPAKALDMAYAVKEKADQKRLEMEEEVRRMEEGY
jgi:hypothetical protein